MGDRQVIAFFLWLTKRCCGRGLTGFVASACAFFALVDSSFALETAVLARAGSSIELTQSEKEDILANVIQQMSANGALQDPQSDERLRKALASDIAAWHLSADPDVSALEIQRNTLLLQSKGFFYAAWKDKHGTLPTHESVVAPAAEILDELLRTMWPELDSEVRAAFVRDFSDTREEMVTDPLVPGGKIQPDESQWTTFRERTASAVVAARENWLDSRAGTMATDWRTSAHMIRLKATAAMEWHRMTAAMDVVEVTPQIKQVMDDITSEVRRIEGRIREAEKRAQRSRLTPDRAMQPLDELPSPADLTAVTEETVALITEDLQSTPDLLEGTVSGATAPAELSPVVQELPTAGGHMFAYVCVGVILAAAGIGFVGALLYRSRSRSKSRT